MQLKNVVPEYVAAKGDDIDECLADYLNGGSTNKMDMRILFIRIQDGHYFFGNKRIQIKLEKSETPLDVNYQLFICDGPKSFEIEDFLAKYRKMKEEKLFLKDDSFHSRSFSG